MPDLLLNLDKHPKLTIAAIHGTALGGGFEVALTCNYRIALATAKVGLPEVKLGLLPGAGGTQRTPRLAGIPAAVDLITSGSPINARSALTLQLVDKVVDENLIDAAAAYAAAVPVIDKMVSKGIIEKNKAARHKSRLNAKVKALATA